MNEYDLDKNCLAMDTEKMSPTIARGSVWNKTSVLKCAKKEPFEADRIDGIFALIAFVLGFFFARWVLFSWQGWGVSLFTLGYCSVVTFYLLKKGIQVQKAGYFWLTVEILIGISYSIWTDNGLEPWRSLLLFSIGIYWVICATGLPLLGKTSNWIVWDGINGSLMIPFSNFDCQYKSLAFLGRNKQSETRQVLSMVLGIFLTLIVVGMVLPLLLKADSGGFSKLTNEVLKYLHEMSIGEYMLNGILAIPIAAYIFGLVAGSAHKRCCDQLIKENTQKVISSIRVLPTASVYTLLLLLCTLYVVFIGSQIPYFFSAFYGERPEGWQVFSEYARSGFFELCRIAAINLSVLLVANIFCIKQCKENTVLKVLSSLLAILTLVLIATAMSKMIMYIEAYGLSIRRLLPCFFMIFMAIVCGGVIALQKWQFSIGRLAAVAGVIILCMLCLMNPDSFVARYNADRYILGTLKSFDVKILYQSGPAGVDSALKILGQTNDEVLKANLKDYLLAQKQQAVKFSGQPGDNLQWAGVRQVIGEKSL